MDNRLIDQWMAALVSAGHELAETALACDESRVVRTSDVIPDIGMGAFVGLAGNERSMEVGLTANCKDCMAICRAFLCMEPDDDDLSEEDLTDGIGELVNVLAGGVKTRMGNIEKSMCIGLPLVFKGKVEASKNVGIRTVLMQWGPVRAHLLLLIGNKGD